MISVIMLNVSKLSVVAPCMPKLNLLTPSVLPIKVDEIEHLREKIATNIMIFI